MFNVKDNCYRIFVKKYDFKPPQFDFPNSDYWFYSRVFQNIIFVTKVLEQYFYDKRNATGCKSL